ncbi:IclR family transcriptional regulator [Streptomyces sp. NBC_01314]|uniref:IclR family transcriptional regulator n=1 Tax=Streptomyces sp. NBC_01314 TaxID=2903821 RepID=UPI00308F0CB9|nr:IclR family transcriptional regulator [Streptomyces sp. NBC_01314]
MTTDSSLKRGLAVLRLFAEHPPRDPRGHTAAEVADLLGRERSGVSRVLRSLEAARFLRRDPASLRYSVAWELYARAQQVTEARLRRDGRTALEGVAADTGECSYLGVLRGASSVTVLEAMPPALSSFVSWVGRGYPAYCSDAGQALLFDAGRAEIEAVFARTAFVRHGPNTPADLDDFLARLDAARQRGYTIVDQEAEPGLYSLAAPVRDFRGEIVAAVQVVGPRHRLEPATAACAESVVRWSAWLTAALSSAESDRDRDRDRGSGD